MIKRETKVDEIQTKRTDWGYSIKEVGPVAERGIRDADMEEKRGRQRSTIFWRNARNPTARENLKCHKNLWLTIFPL